MNRGDCGGLAIGVALGRLNGCGTGVGVRARTGGFRGGRNAVGVGADSICLPASGDPDLVRPDPRS